MTKIALCLLILIAGTAQAEIYKWTDEQGQVHYSDRPAVMSQATIINHRPQPTASLAGSGLRADERARLSEIEYRQRRAQLDRNITASQERIRQRQQAINDDYNRNMCTMYQGWLADIRDQRDRGYTAKQDREFTQREEKYRREMKDYCARS